MSVSLPDADVAFIDKYAEEHGIPSRSEVLQRAVFLLRISELGDQYEAAAQESLEPDYYDLNPDWADEYPGVDGEVH